MCFSPLATRRSVCHRERKRIGEIRTTTTAAAMEAAVTRATGDTQRISEEQTSTM